jgi:HEAT repeat protein
MLGDMAGTQQLTSALAAKANGPDGPIRASAGTALDTLARGPFVRHVIAQFRKANDAEIARLTRLCQTIGPRLVLPFAEALSTEEHFLTIRRIRELLISFGAEGRRAVETLKNSANPAVRRTAVDLLRIFGGNDALKELTPLLNDAEPQVQRDAVRAIVTIGSPEAFAVIEQQCATSDAARELIIREVIGLRDTRAVPSLAAVLTTTAPRGALVPLHEAIIDALAALGTHADSTAALRSALDRGDWWAPRRTAELRNAAAGALKRIGSPETLEALEDALRSSRRGVRAAARLALGPERAER